MTQKSSDKGPLPIWFFVGLVLCAYGLLLVVAGLTIPPPEHVVQVTRVSPDIWWGGLLGLFGVLFLWIGLCIRD